MIIRSLDQDWYISSEFGQKNMGFSIQDSYVYTRVFIELASG